MRVGTKYEQDVWQSQVQFSPSVLNTNLAFTKCPQCKFSLHQVFSAQVWLSPSVLSASLAFTKCPQCKFSFHQVSSVHVQLSPSVLNTSYSFHQASSMQVQFSPSVLNTSLAFSECPQSIQLKEKSGVPETLPCSICFSSLPASQSHMCSGKLRSK